MLIITQATNRISIYPSNHLSLSEQAKGHALVSMVTFHQM